MSERPGPSSSLPPEMPAPGPGPSPGGAVETAIERGRAADGRGAGDAGTEQSVPAMMAPPVGRDNRFTRSKAGLFGIGFLTLMLLACLGTLPWTVGKAPDTSPGQGGQASSEVERFNQGTPKAGRLPPFWAGYTHDQALRFNELVGIDRPAVVKELAERYAVSMEEVLASTGERASPGAPEPTEQDEEIARALRGYWPQYWMGTDVLGRSLLWRSLTGGGISLTIGIAAALLSVFIGTMYGAIAGYVGGRLDGVMMRVVDVLYGLPYILLVVLLAVAADALIDEYISRQRERGNWVARQALVEFQRGAGQPGAAEVRSLEEARVALAKDANAELRGRLEEEGQRAVPARKVSEGTRTALDLITLLVAIGGVSWLTMARVIRGQVLSLKGQPFVEAARAMGFSTRRIFLRHLLPNLLGPIIVYSTLTVPQAILQESFLSFLGIGVKPPWPSWGNLAADGLVELNPYQSNWWLLLFPCLLLASTLLALNFVGEGLREAFDPKRARR